MINNGEYSASLRFEGAGLQAISGTKKFSAVTIDKFPNGTITAASDVIFDSTTTVNLDSDILDMGNYKLTKLSKKKS
ncbi:MAG: hypothetical protein FD143_382 [Ignavibacteria bacterium]|nr:MAG: hypothetical protein FD143_382 [Ignavibacteria bacterium]